MYTALTHSICLVQVGRQDLDPLASLRGQSGWTRDAIEHAIERRKRDIADHYQAIRRLESEILALKSELNTTISIARLPAEVLCEVFAACLLPLKRPLYWRFKLLHVCRGWRQVALSCPQLWTTIYPTRPEVVTTLLTLSRTLPLDLRFEGCARKRNAFEMHRLVLAQMSRVRRYAPFVVDDQIARLLNSIESTLEAPLLEDLQVDLSEARTEVPAFWALSMPCLQSLKLTMPRHQSSKLRDGTLGILMSLVRTSLTSLTLVNHRADPTEFIDVLASLPSLKCIFLRHPIQSTLEEDVLPPPIRKVILPQLELLDMLSEGGYGLEHAFVLSHLRIPDKAKLHFRAESPDTFEETAQIIPCLHAKLLTSSGSRMYPRSMHINLSLGGDLVITLWMDEQTLFDIDSQNTWEDSTGKLHLVLFDIQTDIINDIIDNFLAGPCFISMTTMYIEYTHIKLSVWAAKFAVMRNLRELGMAAETLDAEFIEAFTGSDAAEDYIFPSLKVLKISVAKRYSSGRSLQDSLGNLPFALKRRQEMGSYLDKLEVSCPIDMINRDYETSIRQYAAEVVVKVEEFDEDF
ncbi:hypothetical protein NM688_g4823 [Phlebia brevispora]|uniref:Uncharacterized protein n=1 Tax=Phlebia brevispora TaxID=194682 RepID=A0ACC1T2E3_9APHY|nr:hypothetical protein NM688_g4823 [Phlebia brevispora]